MSICLHSSRRIYRGYRLFQSRIQQHEVVSLPTAFRFRSTRHPRPQRKGPSYVNPQRGSSYCPVPPKLRKDPSEWIPYLVQYLPKQTQDERDGTIENDGKSLPQQCHAILQLLFQARAQENFDLLTYLGFKLGRWEDFHAIVDKLLDNADILRPVIPRGYLPSSIDWGSMGSFDEISGDAIEPLKTGQIPYTKDDISLQSFDAYSEEPIMMGRMGESAIRIGTMEELWPSLGLFVIEAADLPLPEASSIMSHFYQVVARLHHLGIIPTDVYKYTPNTDSALLKRPPGMHLLSHPIMNVLSDAVWEANSLAKGEEPQSINSKFKARELGFGIWLEFTLWCCVEGGFSREAAWILQHTRKRGKPWTIKSWNKVIETSGEVDISKMNLYDTWERCGKKSNVPMVDQSGRPFLGMGSRVITQEVVIAATEGLINSITVGVGLRGDSPAYVWERIGMLRSILDKNKLYIRPQDINYFIVRILEAGGIIPEVKPQALEHLLNLAPYIPTEEELNASPKGSPNATKRDYNAKYSSLVLGLYQYTLNIYAARGHISGTIDVFERLLGAVDSNKVHEIRNYILERKYLIKAHGVRDTSSTRPPAPSAQSSKFETPSSPTLPLSPLSWSLLLDVFTSSGVHRLTNWILTLGVDGKPTLPVHLYQDTLVASSLIRFAAVTKNRDLFLLVANNVVFPLPQPVLYSLLDYHLKDFDWHKSTNLLFYLRDNKQMQWNAATVTCLAASVIQLDHQLGTKTEASVDSTEDLVESLELAKHLLLETFSGRFSRYRVDEDDRNNDEILFQLHRLLISISGTLSEVCHTVKPNWKKSSSPARRIPANAFNQLLTSIVDTKGSSAGKRLWDDFCIEPLAVYQQRIQWGGNRLLYFSDKLHPLIGGIEPSYSIGNRQRVIGKVTTPDLTTVRIIAHAALHERNLLSQAHTIANRFALRIPDDTTVESTRDILDWSTDMFRRFHLGDREIDRELDGYLTEKSERVLALAVYKEK